MWRCSIKFKKLFFLLVLVLSLTWAGRTDADLVAWWKFDETSGDIASDLSGFENHGQCQDNVAWVDGQIGGAWHGDCAGDFIIVPPLLPDDEWIHIACTFDILEQTNRIFINGALDAENTATLPLEPADGDLYIGADQYPVGAHSAHCDIR